MQMYGSFQGFSPCWPLIKLYFVLDATKGGHLDEHLGGKKKHLGWFKKGMIIICYICFFSSKKINVCMKIGCGSLPVENEGL